MIIFYLNTVLLYVDYRSYFSTTTLFFSCLNAVLNPHYNTVLLYVERSPYFMLECNVISALTFSSSAALTSHFLLICITKETQTSSRCSISDTSKVLAPNEQQICLYIYRTYLLIKPTWRATSKPTCGGTWRPFNSLYLGQLER